MAFDPDELPVAIGEVIGGRYAVTGVLGRGGMGIVLAGKHVELGERVAIKFLHREHSGHADRFFREARAAARIRSEHVVRIFDVGRLESGEPYIVMEYLEGEDLSERLERDGPMAVEAVADVLLDVCDALAEAHASGIVHRDLKPANIFLARGADGADLIKLLDFGVAKMPEAGALTQTSTVLGSPLYMSPEQLMASRSVDARSDIWSLGIILYEMLTGDLPFVGDSLVHLALIVREKPTPSAREQKPELPAELDAVIVRCLAKDRTERYADVGEFASAIAPFASPGLALAVSRIRRVLQNVKARQSSPELERTVEAPSSSHVARPGRGAGRSGSSGSRKESGANQEPGAHDGRSAPELRQSLQAMATSTLAGRQSATSVRRGVAPLWVGVVAVAAAGMTLAGWQWLGRVRTDKPETVSPITETSLAATSGATAPALPASSVGQAATAAPPPAVTEAPPPSATPSLRVPQKPTPRPATPATAKATATAAPSAASTVAKPAVNCTPPYTIDESGVRRAKPECL